VAESADTDQFRTWSGIDVRTEDKRELAEIAAFFATGFLESIATMYPTLVDVQRYELLAADRHGGFGSKLLTAWTWGGDEATNERAEASELAALPAAPRAWSEGTSPSWSLRYRHLAETGPATTPPHAIYMVGVNPPRGMDDEDRSSFIEFYTGVHVPEVAKRRHCTRATVFELDREILSPNEGTPHYLGIYEVADAASVISRHVGFGYTRGPSVWEKHKTPWRLWYRRVISSVRT
jgi:hypothetical protein